MVRSALILTLISAGIAFSAPNPVSYRASGKASAFIFNKVRDRSVEFTPRLVDGEIDGVDTVITVHTQRDRKIRGYIPMVDGVFVATTVEMVNARNILSFTPRILALLEEGPIQLDGYVEISGKVYETKVSHEIVKRLEDGRLVIVSKTDSRKIRSTTETLLGRDRLPLSADTSGTIDMGVSVRIDMHLRRVSE